MLDLNIVNFLTVALISMLGMAAFQWANNFFGNPIAWA